MGHLFGEIRARAQILSYDDKFTEKKYSLSLLRLEHGYETKQTLIW